MVRLLTSPRLMLYLEWILLGITVFTLIVITSIHANPVFPLLPILCIAALGLMGLRLPSRRSLLDQILYTLVEFLLIWIPMLAGEHIPAFPILGVIIIIRSCQMFQLPGRLIVASGAFFSFVLTMFLQTSFLGFFGRIDNQIQYNNSNILILKISATIYFALMLTFMLLLVNALLAERQSRKELSVALNQLRQYALRIEEQATLQERNRIAREIHDALGHTLTAQSIQLDSGLLLLNSAHIEKASLFFKTAKELCTQALQEVRYSVTTLRNDSLPGQSLETEIATLIKDFQQTTTIVPNCTIRLTRELSLEVRSCVYRILQEALTNIIRHSAATETTIQLVSHDEMLYLLVKDNGKGFQPEQNSTGFGLQGMRERTAALTGQLNLVSQPGAGCLVTAQIPLPRALL